MKKMTLALAVLAAMGLAACSNQHKDDGSYHATVLTSEYQGKDLRLTLLRDNCEGNGDTKKAVEEAVVAQKYDSNIVVGACVRVSQDSDASTNVSRSVSRSWLSRTQIVK